MKFLTVKSYGNEDEFYMEIHNQNEISHDGIKDIVMKGKGSMLHRLKVSYLCGFNSNPQFMLCRRPLNMLVATLCVLSSVVLMKVTFQYLVSKKSNLCEGVSVYKWSMKSIVVSQIITVIVGCLAVTFRLFSLIGHLIGEYAVLQEGVEDAEAIIANNPIFRRTNFFLFKFYSRKTIEFFVIGLSLLPSFPFAFLEGCVEASESNGETCWHNANSENEEAMEEFKDLIHEREMGLDKWTLRKGVNDMKRWIEKTDASNQLTKLLSETPPLLQNDSPFCRLKAYYDSRNSGYQVSSLSVVLLVRIATIAIPSSLSASLLSSLNEVFVVLQFVDRKMSASSFENNKKHVLAKALQASENFNRLVQKIVERFGNHDAFQKQSQFEQAISIIKELKYVLRADYVRYELAMMTDFMQLQAYESIEQMYGYMEQLFVDMVNGFLVQLPNAIFREIIESNAEDCEMTVKFALKVLCKVQPLEPLVRWSLPAGTTISHLASDELLTA